MSRVHVDRCGFIYIEGVKIGKLCGKNIEFVDKDVNRSKQRGSRFVYITPEELAQEVREQIKEEIAGIDN